MEQRKSLLDEGRIPAHSECPFRNKCPLAMQPKPVCKHLGKDHTVDFSCASARAFDLIQQYKGEDQ